MANIFIIVEGQTEEQFYKRLVQNEFRNEDGSYRHYFQVVVMPSKKNVYGRGQKGGRINFDVCTDNIRRFLREASHCDLILLVFDYYGLHDSFRTHLTGAHGTLTQKIIAIQDRLEAEINMPQFKFRLQVHEFEAYLFSTPEVVAKHFGQADKTAALNQILSAFDNNPELINNDPDTAPAKRLMGLFPNFGKTTDGVLIAQKIGLPTIRSCCHWFNQMCSLFDGLD